MEGIWSFTYITWEILALMKKGLFSMLQNSAVVWRICKGRELFTGEYHLQLLVFFPVSSALNIMFPTKTSLYFNFVGKKKKLFSYPFHGTFLGIYLLCLLAVDLGLDAWYILKQYKVDSRFVCKMKLNYDLQSKLIYNFNA